MTRSARNGPISVKAESLSGKRFWSVLIQARSWNLSLCGSSVVKDT
jgi:hypothetical protein